LTDKQFRNHQPQRVFKRNSGRVSRRPGSPFWLPASGFYILSIAVTIAVFFLVWAILLEGGEDSPWIISGISASFVLGSAVFVREIVLRKARQRYLRSERQLDYNLNNIVVHSTVNRDVYKVSLKRNAALIEHIKRKSDAAKVLGHLPDGHWDVFELCVEYLSINKEQLETVGVGSPRLAALRRGKEIIEDLHKFHLLCWVEIESRQLTQEANNQIELSDKIELSQRALIAIDSALQFYPEEKKLLESKDALNEFIASIKISHWIEQAEREAFKKNYREAVSHYRDALFYLARENVRYEEKKTIADRIKKEIEKVRRLENKISLAKQKSQKIKYITDNEND
jgi:Tfp pilus assembly protein PilN